MTSSNTHNQERPLEAEEDRRWILLIRRGFVRLFGNVKVILKLLFSVCACFVLLDLFFAFGLADKEAHFGWENTIGFYAAYGFVSCVLLVLVSKYILRPMVMRDEDYYD